MGDGIIKRRKTFDEIELTAEDVVEAIQSLSNEERWKLLDILYDKYYNSTDKKGIPVDYWGENGSHNPQNTQQSIRTSKKYHVEFYKNQI
ncbi:hypothetical protein [Bacillus pseudomycoides]|uniref:hypothetical protein n=1 Tax=Bacillus pseudomycoides TaxID=64104 RepID=UPI000BF09131|nr:hypothetical protein [Bacillus pseudomycoides]PEK31570.1 hypothetical protein CN691_17650 [Bacillus pseudomycoides]